MEQRSCVHGTGNQRWRMRERKGKSARFPSPTRTQKRKSGGHRRDGRVQNSKITASVPGSSTGATTRRIRVTRRQTVPRDWKDRSETERSARTRHQGRDVASRREPDGPDHAPEPERKVQAWTVHGRDTSGRFRPHGFLAYVAYPAFVDLPVRPATRMFPSSPRRGRNLLDGRVRVRGSFVFLQHGRRCTALFPSGDPRSILRTRPRSTRIPPIRPPFSIGDPIRSIGDGSPTIGPMEGRGSGRPWGRGTTGVTTSSCSTTRRRDSSPIHGRRMDAFAPADVLKARAVQRQTDLDPRTRSTRPFPATSNHLGVAWTHPYGAEHHHQRRRCHPRRDAGARTNPISGTKTWSAGRP